MLTQRQAHFYRRIVAAKLYIDKQYSEKIDVDTISDEAGFSKFDFIRQFRKTYGSTPHQYLTTVRLTNAAKLLESSDIKVLDVCIAVGFTSPSSFSSLFKQTYGMSPSSFRLCRIHRRSEVVKLPRSFVPSCFRQFSIE